MFRFLVILFSFMVCWPGVYGQQFTGSGGGIPDAGAQTCFTIPVTGVGFISASYGLSGVCINITHPWDADLEIILKSPDGTEVPLSIQNGGSGANYTNTCFAANATLPISEGAAPFSGTFLPEGYLGNFNDGQNGDGDWQLCIRDLTADDIGALLSWSITFSNTPAPPRPVCLSNTQASNTCSTAPAICNFNGFCGSTNNTYTANSWPELTAAFCGGVIENNSFVSFIASGTTASFNVWVTNSLNALGIQMMIFSGGCESGPVVVHGCADRVFPSASGPTLVTASGLVPGNAYYIMLDGYLGDVCDYIIVAAAGISILNVVPLSPQICPGESIIMTATGGNGTYNWSPAAGLSTITGASVTAKPDTTTTYQVTSNAFGFCPLVSSFTVTVNPAPQLGEDKNPTICIGEKLDLAALFNLAGLTPAWTISGAPVAPPYLVSTAGLYRLTARNLNRCSDTAFVQLATVTKPSLGPDHDVNICPGDSVNLTGYFATSGYNTLWTRDGDTVLNPTAVRAGGLYQLVAFSGSSCSDTAFVDVRVNAAPELGIDKTVNLCPGTTVNLSSLFNTTGSVANWFFNGSALADPTGIFTPGVYKLLATNLDGCKDSALATVFSVNAIALGADKNLSICPGTSIDLDTVYNTAGSIANWTLGGIPVNPLQVNQPGIYQLAVSNGTACRDTALVELNVLPKVFIGNDTFVNVCQGGALNLNQLFNQAGFLSSWYLNDTLLQQTSAVNFPGQYSLIVTDINGCMDTAIAEIFTRPKPFIGNDVALSVCPEILVNLQNQVNITGLTSTWTKNGVLVSNPVAVSQPGVYRCISSNLFGCSDTAFVTISTSTKPRLGVDRAIPVCDGQPVNLSAEFFTSGYAVTWTFNGGPVSSPPPLIVTAPGTYQIIVSNNLSCADTALVEVFSSNAIPLGPDKAISNCFGTITNLNAQFDTSNQVTSWYYYGFRVPNPDSVRVAGQYQIIGTSASGCRDTALLFLTLNPKPSLGPDKQAGVCSGTTFNLTNLFSNNGLVFAWSQGAVPVPDPAMVMAPGTFQLIASNSFGCSDTAFVELFATTNLNLGSDTTVSICDGNTVNLNGLFSLGGLGVSWTESGSPVTNPGSVSNAGSYQMVASNGLGCGDTVLVNLLERSNPSLGPDQAGLICQYNSYNLTGVFVTGTLSTDWSLEGVPVLNPSAVVAPGTYTILATDSLGCTDTARIQLVITPNPFIGNDYSFAICAGNTLNLTIRFNTPGLTQDWYFHGPSAALPPMPVADPFAITEIGYYSLVATSTSGCRDTAFLRIVEYPKPNLGNDTSTGFCPGQTVDLTAFFSTAYASFNFVEWTLNGVPVANPTSINTPGVYRLLAGYLQACYDTIFITVNRFSKPVLGNDRTINLCPGSSVGLDVQFPLAGLVTNWSFGGQPVADPTSAILPGLYRVEAFNGVGCSDTAFVTIVQLAGAALGVDRKISTCTGNKVDLTGLYSTAGLAVSYTSSGVPVPVPSSVSGAGNYQIIASNTSGCSDTAFVTITLLPKPALGADQLSRLCPGSTVNLFSIYDTSGLAVQWTLNGQPVLNPAAVVDSGGYRLIVVNSFGCSDTALFRFELKATSTGRDSFVVCSNRLPFAWNGDSYSTSGVYQKILINAAGCDSIVTLKLVVVDTSYSSVDIVVCNNQLPYNWNGVDYFVTGTYRARFANIAGCDSVAILHLTVNDTTTSNTNHLICNNQLPYVWNGISASLAGTYSVILRNAAGCDSLATLTLTIADTSITNIAATICNNELPYFWNGNSYNSAGSYRAIFTNLAGCDSFVTLLLTVRDTSFSVTNVSLCSNQLPYNWNGYTFTSGGMYPVKLQNQVGCDSTAWLNLTVKDTSFSFTDITVCGNQLPFSWNGNQYTAAGTYFSLLQNAAGCDSLAYLRLAVTGTSSGSETITICSNRLPVVWNGTSYNLAGTYTTTLVNAGGCDSLATLQLFVQDTSVSFDTVSICSNQLPFVWNGIFCSNAGDYTVNLVNTAACDSIAHLLLVVKDTSVSNDTITICSNQLPYRWNGNALLVSGAYRVLLRNAAGCDSVVNLLLSVKDTSVEHIYRSVCSNQLPFQWNGVGYNVAGEYLFSSTNQAGCDSLAVLHLTIPSVSTSITNIELCETGLPFIWNNNSIANPGVYYDTLVNAAGCDSIVQLNFTVKRTSASTSVVSLCNNQLPYTWNGNSYSSSGTYRAILLNAAGCDSIAELQLTVDDTSRTNISHTVCNNQLPYQWNGIDCFSGGTYQVLRTNAAGCDSMVTLQLTISDTTTSLTTVSICSRGLPYLWNGITCSAAGTYEKLLTNSAGCDSVARLQLQVKQVSSSLQSVSVCPADLPYLWNGVGYTQAGTYQKTFVNAAGCDSVVQLNLTVKQSSTSTTVVSICSNQLPYTWNGNSYSSSGTYQSILLNAAGCDSIALLQLTINDTSRTTIPLTLCNNQLPYQWNGINCLSGGTYQVSRTNAAGCDSIVILQLTVADTSTSLTTVSICSNSFPYLWNGNTYTTAGNYVKLLTNAAGCDSVARLQLQVKQLSSSSQFVSVCPSALPYQWNGVAYTQSGTYQKVLVNAAGCDSTATLILEVLQNTVANFTVRICENDLPYTWNGLSYAAAGTYSQLFTNAAGCDSTAMLNLIVLRKTSSQVNRSACVNDLPFSWNGNSYSEAGTFTVTLVNAAGCDSVVTLTLTVNPNPPAPVLGADTLICPGDKILLNPGVFTSYLWQNSATTPTLEASSPMLYTVKVGNAFGCFNFAQKSVQLLTNCDDIYFANAFSPNGDALNPTFGALGNLFVVNNYTLSIFNRYGKLVFLASNPYQKWNGLINGKPAPPGNYIWKAMYNYRGKITRSRNGNVVLIR